MEILSVKGLCKSYGAFSLKKVDMKLDAGFILGFIGRNGAGKTTTLKSILNLVHPDSGEVRILGMSFAENEYACKQAVGCVFGAADYYPKKKLGAVASVVSRFYEKWDAALYSDYMRRFALDENKRIDELSAGMKVKFALALALSHDPRLLLLDEPTSGLDPVSRDEILEIFQSLIESGERSILFSTHITSDLEKCADYITYIKDGAIIADDELPALVDAYRLVRGGKDTLAGVSSKVIGARKNAFGWDGLIHTRDLDSAGGFEVMPATLDDIMVHIERGSGNESAHE